MPTTTIIELISTGKIDKVFRALKTTYPLSIKEEVSLLESRWNRLHKEYLKGIITNEDKRVEENKITESIINLVSENSNPIKSNQLKNKELIVFLIDNSNSEHLERAYMCVRDWITRFKVDYKADKIIIGVCAYDDLNQIFLVLPEPATRANDYFKSPKNRKIKNRNLAMALLRIENVVQPYEAEARISIYATLNGKTVKSKSSVEIAKRLKTKGYRIMMPLMRGMANEESFLEQITSKGCMFYVYDPQIVTNLVLENFDY